MNRFKGSGIKKGAAAALALAVTFGGVSLAPGLEATAYADSAEQTISTSYWNSTERTALLKMLAMCEKASDDFYSDPDNTRYQAVKTASDSARALLLDPAASSSKLNSAFHNLDGALTAYIDDYIRDASILERQTFQMARMLNGSIGTTPNTYPQEAADVMFAVIEQAQAVAYSESATTAEFREQYRKYVEASAVLRDAMNLDRADRLNQLTAQKQSVEALAASAPANEDYAKLLNAFRVQADGLEALLNGTSGLLAIDGAARCVQSAHDALVEGLQLAREVSEARQLLDSPKGIRSGQRPSSAFGELRKAINKSNTVLSKTSTQNQLNAARLSLAEAVAKFNSALRP
ncbi:hypothetical protein [Saccharibacillus alkalitolerans]|uniref:SbsC C-terminal domain-containing protein n=1 Tax=Saccharibacillus alkalitolerans TaxID=2705290 RepID=A0ABX0F5F2_9BACL|nr:hypothetical protein [Saccharibacillus alkalitolerans]NGZ75640.1 hypothetical protein [Saccharibacillus alkalitolerans]